jgi:predicted nucleic acid-binding Zn ribbon protein
MTKTEGEDVEKKRMEPAGGERVELMCSVCGKAFSDYLSSKRKFCSGRCSSLAQRKVKRPESTALAEMVQTMTIEGIGRRCGVSGNAVRKWLKS